MRKECWSGIEVDRELMMVLKGCLEEQPASRISPQDIVDILSTS